MSDASGRSPEPPFEPFVPDAETPPELSARALVLGTLLGMIFGASSLYLVLKVGLTVSASIPVAVISITLFRLASKLGVRDASILENNIVQTAGSAGESIAFGVGVTMPAIMILGFDLELTRVMLVAVLGGLLGILMMIPLRRALIVAQHDTLKYPEGTACAEVLKAGAEAGAGRGGERAGLIFAGFSVGLAYKTAMSALKLWKETPEKTFGAPLAGGSMAAEISPELLGVGYIIGPRIASVMCAGGVLAYLVLIPLIKFFGAGLAAPLAPGLVPIGEMGPSQIRQAYVLYIGAGAVSAGGLLSLIRSLPTIWQGIKHGIADVQSARREGALALRRTERDLSMKTVGILLIALLVAITLAPKLHMNLLGALMIAVFGFLFVTVSSRLTGEIGSSSNPISGMTVATLLFTCLIFLVLGWTGPSYYVTALSVGAIVCIAASNGGTTSQDLKTGYLVGATPRHQQTGLMIGAMTSSLVIGLTTLYLHQTMQIGSQALPAPQATLMATLIKGLLAQDLPWGLVLAGVFITVTLELCGIHSLSFAVGSYLPISTTAPIFAGGVVRALVERSTGKSAGSEISSGTLFSSGLIAGGSLAGILYAILYGRGLIHDAEESLGVSAFLHEGASGQIVGVIVFLLLGVVLWRVGRRKID
jgi:putative OPT family oligopeptide transporter